MTVGSIREHEDWAGDGPYAVQRRQIHRLAAVGEVPVRATVYRPRDAVPRRLPVIFCHGLGSGRRQYALIGHRLASYGFVSVHPEFRDAFDLVRSRLDSDRITVDDWARDAAARDVMMPMLFDPAHWLDRVRRVSAILDLPSPAAGSLDGVDLSRAVVAGHSFGAFTAQMLAGARIFDDSVAGGEFAHPAVAGSVLMSPQGSGTRGLTRDSWRHVRVPLLTITGTHDIGAGGEGLAWRREPYDASDVTDKWLLVARGGGHDLGGIGGRASQPASDVADAIASSVTAFTAFVAGDERAADRLDAGFAPELFDRDGERKWASWAE